MKYEIIGSSSQGNCIIVEDFLMLDCGVSYSRICADLKKVKLIFISHVHKDHLLPTTVERIVRNFPTIKFVTGSYEVCAKLTECRVAKKNIFVLPTNRWYDLGSVKVKLEELYHDVQNCGLRWEYNGKKGIYIVDTKEVEGLQAKNYNLYLIEANYKKDILQRHIDECEDKYVLQYLYRVPETHLSWEDANEFLINNMGENSTFEYIHQSDYNFEKEKI